MEHLNKYLIPELSSLIVDYATWNEEALKSIDILSHNITPLYSIDDVQVGDVIVDCYSLDAYVVVKKLRVNIRAVKIVKYKILLEENSLSVKEFSLYEINNQYQRSDIIKFRFPYLSLVRVENVKSVFSIFIHRLEYYYEKRATYDLKKSSARVLYRLATGNNWVNQGAIGNV